MPTLSTASSLPVPPNCSSTDSKDANETCSEKRAIRCWRGGRCSDRMTSRSTCVPGSDESGSSPRCWWCWSPARKGEAGERPRGGSRTGRWISGWSRKRRRFPQHCSLCSSTGSGRSAGAGSRSRTFAPRERSCIRRQGSSGSAETSSGCCCCCLRRRRPDPAFCCATDRASSVSDCTNDSSARLG